MHWKNYGNNMKRAAADIPDGRVLNDGHAIPDVYGKPLQMYLALNGAFDKQTYHINEVKQWRGLLTLFALQHHLNLPLSWEKVSMPRTQDNPLDFALCHPPESDERKLFQAPEKQWNGRDFYVLRWTDRNEKNLDLLLYSPITLVYPVADWPEVFAGLEEIKWFDSNRKCFMDPEKVLNDQEREIVYVWLYKASQFFDLVMANEAERTIKTHLDQYIADLGVTLTAQDIGARFEFVKIVGSNSEAEAVFDSLKETVRAVLPNARIDGGVIPTNQIFSDQICYFQMDRNPFSNCLYPGSYRVESTEDWYAFLPICPDLRKLYGRDGLAENITMRRIEKNGVGFIRAILDVSGKKYESDYRIEETASAEHGIAVPYRKKKTANNEAPLVSVWPSSIGEAWKKYYIMLEGENCDSGRLKVASQDKIHTGANNYAVGTDYIPYAIPIVKSLYKNGGEVSVGMVIPKTDQPEPKPARIRATVAVDFGTSATMIFAEIEGQITEINLGMDSPLMVTGSEDDWEYIMRDYFIPPGKFSFSKGALCSVYRRSGGLKQLAEPVVDGVIYRTSASAQHMVTIAEGTDGGLMSNLKWQVGSQRTYYVAFMKQLVLHVTAVLYKRGVTSIDWKYALPKNMDVPDQEEVKKIWEDELKPYLNDSTAGSIEHKVVGKLTESEAASRYFLFGQKGDVHPGKGYLVVDIGGGSTDIALWQGTPPNAHMQWHTSVNVAGRKMFTRWIMEKLTDLCRDTVKADDLMAQINLIDKVENTETKASLAEMLLNANYDELLSKYRDNRREGADNWSAELYTQINQSISVLMFALGYQVGALLSSGDGDFKIPAGSGAFVIAFCGRGSKMLDWLLSNEWDKHLLAFFSSGVTSAGGVIDCDMGIETSKESKCEVARGLLIKVPSGATTLPDPVSIPMNTQKYIDAAEALKSAFERNAQKLPENALKALDRNAISAQIDKHGGAIDQIVNIFMELIYDSMTQ